MLSWSTAVGWAGLYNSFGSKTSKKFSPIEFLPFPDLQKPANSISPKTAKVLLQAIKENKISPKYIGLLSSVISEALEMQKGKS